MTPQVQTLLTHLQQHGSISQAEAGLVYRIRALPRRIADLKAEGYNIKRELKVDPMGQRYARYSLIPAAAPNLTLRVGARIRIVKPWMPQGYKCGDIGSVLELRVASEGVYADFHQGNGPVFVDKDEFEVIA